MGGHTRRLDPKVKIRNVLARIDAELIALLIEEAIDMLDVANDPDLEEDDPAGGDINDEPEGECVHLVKPLYAVDQTEAPINYDAAERAHILSTRPPEYRERYRQRSA
jgi:hypothetical protein